jgi:hypothetical protein
MFLNKTLTLSKLLAACPPGTLDPTPYLSVIPSPPSLPPLDSPLSIPPSARYNTTMYSLAGLAVVASLAHASVTPYVPKQLVIDAAIEQQEILKKEKETLSA